MKPPAWGGYPRSQLRTATPQRRIFPFGIVFFVVMLSACTSSAPSPTATSAFVPSSVVPPGSGPALAAPLVIEPDQGMAPIYSLMQTPTRTLVMSMYELVDSHAESILAADAGRGVSVRVLLDHHLEGSRNQPAYDYLAAHGVHVRWAPPSFSAFHIKMICVDDSTCLVMTLNLTSRYYASSRDFVASDSNPADVRSMVQTFAADFDGSSITPSPGSDLIWSPGSTEALTSLIQSAHSTLLVYNEEMSSPAITLGLAAAAHRGVIVQVVMTDQTRWDPEFIALLAAGVQLRVFHGETPIYIHAKMIWVDGKQVFVGSENFSTASLTRNRELGIVLSDPASLAAAHLRFASDFGRAQPWGH